MIKNFKVKPLLIVSAFLILSDLLFIILNYYSTLDAIKSDTRRWGTEVQHVFSLSLDAKATGMQQLAFFVANIPNVQKIFNQAKMVREQFPLEADNPELSALRSQLFEYVEPSWKLLSEQYDVRQLHFHFGPGSTSFLRVHRPEKYGDNMDEVRFTVVDANTYGKPTKGFETGKVYSGIRGVVPVRIKDDNERYVQVGALEAGTSFTGMLRVLSSELDSSIAVLLSKKHVQENMWPDSVDKHFDKNRTIENFFIECYTDPKFKDLLSRDSVTKLLKEGKGSVYISGEYPLQICVFPLRDYRGSINTSLSDSGVIVVWRDASEKWALVKANLKQNIGFSLVALLFVEAALIFGWKLSHRHLNTVIQKQTCTLRELTRRDVLTGLFNRRAIEEYLKEEMGRFARNGSPFSVVMLDVDHFKNVNDTYGHNAGDDVLVKLGAVVLKIIRTTDRFGRWGGEEFMLLLPETQSEDASVLAERIRKQVAETKHDNSTPVTLSLGVAEYKPDESLTMLLHRADSALYQAKEEGRNRVVVAD